MKGRRIYITEKEIDAIREANELIMTLAEGSNEEFVENYKETKKNAK
ncbi:MAG: hypothetical protein LBQ68_02675 [Clostridiales bacterium]|jgi:hypothetical protein|nr:hypothetical protein [Clostridiales bacterium]